MTDSDVYQDVYQEPVPVLGVWLRRIGDEVAVLVELPTGWVKVISERFDGQYSHIVEPSGIRSALPDDL